jgi:predicted O-methyltransferase YrrM
VNDEDGTSDFELLWQRVEGIAGWLTKAQAELLWLTARGLPPGAHVVEIGSHQGRSTCVIGGALRDGSGTVAAIDPFVEGKLFGGPSTRLAFETNVRRLGLEDVIQQLPEYSGVVRLRWEQPIDMLYIDGKHDYWTVSDDLLWSRFCTPGAPVLVHDAFSSVGVTTALIHHVLLGDTLSYRRREGSLAMFGVEAPTSVDRRRFLAQLPWWVRNIGVKVALRLRVRPIARAMGHEGPRDPY